MPTYENMMITITILLVFINALFLFSGTLPGDQANLTYLNLGITSSDYNDLNNRLIDITAGDTNVLGGPSDVNDDVTVSSASSNYIVLFQSWLFSAVDTATLGLSSTLFNAFSLVGKILGLFGTMFFGYLYWIDFFIPPIAISTSGSVVISLVPINMLVKGIIFIINLLGIYQFIMTIFYAGTGARG